MNTPQQIDPRAGSPGYYSDAAIAAAILATPSGGELYLPATPSGYLISNGFTITQPINIRGDGDGTFFTGSLPGTDLFHVQIPANGFMRGFSFEGFKIAVAGAGAQSWFHIDTLASPNTYLTGLRIADILAINSPTLHGIWADGLATGAGLNNQTEFERVQMSVDGSGSAIMLNNVGDSIRVKDGLLTGTARALTLNQVSGAGSFVLDGTNITSLGGVVVQNATKPIFQNFEIELANTNLLTLALNSGLVATGAGIYFIKSDGGTIGPGQIQAIAGCMNFNQCIYLGQTQNVTIDNMRLADLVGGYGYGLNISAGAYATKIGAGNSFIGFSANIVNQGVGTVFET